MDVVTWLNRIYSVGKSNMNNGSRKVYICIGGRREKKRRGRNVMREEEREQ